MTRRGLVLVVTLVVVTLGAMIAAGLLFWMQAQVTATAAGVDGLQARRAAMAGVDLAMEVARLQGADPAVWTDNPDLFRDQLVWDDGTVQWRFTVYAHNASAVETGEATLRYGLTDEAGKINLNKAPRETLLALPGMDEARADCLLDYIDSEDPPEVRASGNEDAEYGPDGQPRFLVKNGPLRTLEELLLVKHFAAPVVYGEDANLNGQLDPNECDSEETFPFDDDGDSVLNRGLRGVATTHTYEPDVTAEGQPRKKLDGDLRAFRDAGLPRQTLIFLTLARGDGVKFAHPAELLEASHRLQKSTRMGRRRIRAGTVIESGVGPDELPVIVDGFTTLKSPLAVGRVNINTAPAEVLAALPGIDETAAGEMVTRRADLTPEQKATIAWPVTENILAADAFKQAAPYITSRSFQYHVMCVGYGRPSGRFCVLEAVIDLARGRPELVYLRDVTRLGLPFALDDEALEER